MGGEGQSKRAAAAALGIVAALVAGAAAFGPAGREAEVAAAPSARQPAAPPAALREASAKALPPVLAKALSRAARGGNKEAKVPPLCYTKTDGGANPCWTCHTRPQEPNHLADWDLQESYAFSASALVNRWENLFTDRRAEAKAISDEEALAYIRQENSAELTAALTAARVAGQYPGYVLDLDLVRGFDQEGFARDGSGWRAIRYKPFLGTFFPTNGSTSDVMIRLPLMFQRDGAGRPSREIYRANLAVVEAAIAAPPAGHDGRSAGRRRVEPVDERALGIDLDGDGALTVVAELRTLPARYLGGAADLPVERFLFPAGTEFLHTVRYVDPDAPTLLSRRLKELRYMKKREWLDRGALVRAYAREIDEKEEGRPPVYQGAPEVGLVNAQGWQLQGFIEDDAGRLRLQTHEEHRVCVGCHGSLGVTVDQTFAFARKVPGVEGWRHQDLRGLKDVPQAGHAAPEILTYFQRAQGGDEFRANEEIKGRFFAAGTVREREVRRAAPGGDRDLTYLIVPSRRRALALTKAYMALVRAQRFELGRDVVLAPLATVHNRVDDAQSTGLVERKRVYNDGRLWLDWEIKSSLVRGPARQNDGALSHR